MLAILTTHPIQYQVPIWQALARDGRVRFEVWYLTDHGVQASHDQEFGKKFSWDIDMLSGYPHRFLEVMPGATPTSFRNCRLRERLRDRLRASGARALWIQGWQVSAYWQSVWEAKRAGAEVWLRGESNDLAPTPAWKRPLKRFLLGQLLRRVDRFLYIGTANKRQYKKFGVPDNRLYPAPYAVDNERFARQAEEVRGQRSEVRGQWGIPQDAFCVLFCGKFISKKRPMDLVAAAQLLRADGRKRNIHILFVGSGELGPQLRTRCDVVFDADNSHSALKTSPLPAPCSPLPAPRSLLPPASFAGFLNQTEISQAYVAADCLVLPSDYGETWGLVVNEAMASGLPCIISDQCGCAEDLGRIAPNMVFPCGDQGALVHQLLRIPAAKTPMTLSGSGIDRFTFAHTVSTVDSLYDNLRIADSRSPLPLGEG